MSEGVPDTWKEWKCGTEKKTKNPTAAHWKIVVWTAKMSCNFLCLQRVLCRFFFYGIEDTKLNHQLMEPAVNPEVWGDSLGGAITKQETRFFFLKYLLFARTSHHVLQVVLSHPRTWEVWQTSPPGGAEGYRYCSGHTAPPSSGLGSLHAGQRPPRVSSRFVAPRPAPAPGSLPPDPAQCCLRSYQGKPVAR